jgi:Na+/H+ antiporter NhaD/arsenite permease-like protein
MENVQAVIAVVVFVSVIIMIITEWTHLTIAAFLGSLILVFTHIMTLPEAINYISQSHGTLALFLGIMILTRSFEPTKVFDYIGTQIVILAQGDGYKLLLGIIGITALISAILPNATTVMLLAPLIPSIATEIGVDFVPLLILMVFVSNSAGLLTLVGDPVNFIIGDAININFTNYLVKLSLGGAIAIVIVLIMTPFLFREVWEKKLDSLQGLPHPKINHPITLAIGGIIITLVLIFFVIGGSFPIPISPASVALLGAGLALLLVHTTKIDTVNNILRDVDWSTLLFFMSTFVLIGGLEKTGVIASLSNLLVIVLGKNILLGMILLIWVVGLLSSLVPNIPLVVAMVPLLKQYLVNVGLTSPDTLSVDFPGQFPVEVLPLFYAILYGTTLGGNGTLVGASANIVAAGIAQLHGKSISFHRFLQYSLPVMTIQLSTITIYMILVFR